MRISRAKLRTTVLLLIGVTLVALAAGACMSVGIHRSPRYQVFATYFRPGNGIYTPTRGEFEQFVRERNFPYEVEGGESSGALHIILIPLDGTRRGQHLRVKFYADGILKEASVIDRWGQPVGFYVGVRR